MNFDCIIANPPYGKIGVDVTKNVIKQNPDSNYAMLGTRSMFKSSGLTRNRRYSDFTY